MNGPAHFRVAPVQIRLLGQEGVTIILPRRGVVLPGAAPEFRQPVVRRAAIRRGIAPDVPVALWIVARSPTFDEPGMLVGGMVRHEVEDDFEPACMRSFYQCAEVGHRA